MVLSCPLIDEWFLYMMARSASYKKWVSLHFVLLCCMDYFFLKSTRLWHKEISWKKNQNEELHPAQWVTIHCFPWELPHEPAEENHTAKEPQKARCDVSCRWASLAVTPRTTSHSPAHPEKQKTQELSVGQQRTGNLPWQKAPFLGEMGACISRHNPGSFMI